MGRRGRVVNSCRFLLDGLVTQTGGQARWLGTLRDDRDAIRAAIATFDGDILLTTGATSTGKEDYLPGIVAELGQLLVHGVNIRPASPLAFGRLGKVLTVLLPGNPVAAFVGFDVIVRPALQLQLGQRESEGTVGCEDGCGVSSLRRSTAQTSSGWRWWMKVKWSRSGPAAQGYSLR